MPFERLREDVRIWYDYVSDADARALTRELVGVDCLTTARDPARDTDAPLAAPPGARHRFERLRGRSSAFFGGAVDARGTIAMDDFPARTRATLARCARDAARRDDDDAARPFAPNHALVNVYERPRDGIMAHEDGPLYRDVVCVVSLGGARTVRFTPKRDGATRNDGAFGVHAPHRSLLVFEKSAYADYLHGIDVDATTDWILEDAPTLNASAFERETVGREGDARARGFPRRGARVSITIREVLNVRKGFEFLGKRKT